MILFKKYGCVTKSCTCNNVINFIQILSKNFFTCQLAQVTYIIYIYIYNFFFFFLEKPDKEPEQILLKQTQ